MSSKIRESKLIPYSIQGGDGYPTHISPIGSLYFDNLTSLFYQNLDGINTWASIYGSGNIPFDIYVTGGTYDSTHGIATFINNSGFSFTVTGFTSGGSSVFSGGTITGATNFTGGLTANTFSATTYEGLPLDIHLTGLTFDNSTYNITVSQNDGSQYTQNLSILSSDVTITGGTYNPTTGVASFTNNTGGTFNVTGFLTGHTDTYVTGMTFNNNILTLYQTQGNASISQILNNLSGLTVSGNVVANSISATTYQNLPSDIFVTGGTPNNSTRSYTFINSTGGTFNLLGLLDVTTTGGTYNNGAIQFINSTGGTFNVTGLYTGYTPTQDIFVTGGTYSAGTAIFANNTGGTFSVSGFNVSTSFTGGTVSGATNFISGLTANTIYATTFSGGSFYGNGSGLTGITGTGLSPISVTGTTLFSNNPLTNNFNLNNSIFFGQNAGYGATGAYNSNFFGQNAGYGATGASLANFFGYQAGQGATGASYSNFIGSNAGQGATNAGQSNFLGYQAGYTATNATNSNFFGQNAGQNASGASQANFFGYYAGYGATGAFASNFFGNASGQNATGASGSNFFGQNAGQNAYNAQNSNFLGGGAGQGATGATYSNFFGQNAGQNASGASQANFFGYQAGQNAYNASNSNFFGQNAGNGATGASLANFFGYQTGQNAYNAQFSNFIGYNAGSGATNASYSNFFGNGAGQGATGATQANFLGQNAGYGAYIAQYSNFFGYYAGNGATGASYSNFFGPQAGQNASGASSSNFIGYHTGYGAYNASQSNFLGYQAGYQATGASNSNFFGQNAGYGATGVTQANFFGFDAGYGAYNAQNSNFLGGGAGNAATGESSSNFLGYHSGENATGASNSNFFGYYAGQNAYIAQYSNFLGYYAGQGATGASNSNFFGQSAGYGATGASYSNLIGYQAGYGATIGSNNIIIGTNISLPAATSNAINLGGVLFGTNTYSTTFGSPATGATATGSIGIGIVTPTARFQLPSGTTAATSAPLKFTSGATLTIPEAGAVEYDGTYLYLTPNSGLRNIIGSVASNMGNIIFVSPLGSDSTGLKYNITAPYKTITAALTAATTGDTIYVMAGTYTDTNLWKDGVNYYFQNGSILSPTSAITIFNINGTGQTNDWAIDGFLTVNTAQNASVFSFNQINTTSRFDIKFKSILATNITGTKNLIQLSSSGSSIATYSIQGDIKVTSALNNNYAALNINGSSANIYYLGNITMTSTSTAILVNNDNNGNKYFNGNFSSQGAPTTISLAPGGAITTVNGSIYNSSVASGVYAIISSSNYTNININASIIGNVSLVGAGVQSLDGIVQGVSNNAPATIVLNGGFNNLNLSTSHCSLYIQNGTNTIQGNYTLACGSFSNIGSLHQIGGTTYWKGYSSYPNGGSGALSNPNIISGGTFVITKGSVITVTDNNNGSGSATQFGLYLYTGGTLINEGVINYSTTGSTGTNLGSILLSGGLLQLDGGRIINNQTANSACSISAVTNSNILVYGNAYVNKGTSGGTLTNLVTGGGSIYTYTGMTF